MDSEKQKDEISALESIYNEEEFSYRYIEGKHECTLKIFIRLPKDYNVTYKDTRNHEEPVTRVPISHLPPLTLYVHLPVDYPSKCPPKFTLCSSWLRHTMLAKLCQKLDQLWAENEEQEILFTWTAFLQNETLEYLLLQDHLDISYAYTIHNAALDRFKNSLEKSSEPSEESTPNEAQGSSDTTSSDCKSNNDRKSLNKKRYKKHKNRKPIDERAVVDRPNSENPVQMLVDYNDARERIEFRRNFYVCNVCLMEKSGEHSTEFTPCRHVFCKECMTRYFVVKIEEGSVQNIRCPEDKCSSEATPGQIKDLVSPELFAKYDSLLLSVTLQTMMDIVYCPRRHCQYPVTREPNENMANCPSCQYAFCVYCKMVYHALEPCKVNSVEKQKLMSDYQTATKETKLLMEQRHGKRQLEILVENSKSETWMANSRHCPHCKTAIEKTEGCNKMTCGLCNTFFCWACGSRLDPFTPYSHYEDRNSKCFNKLCQILPDAEGDDEDDDDYGDDVSDDDIDFEHLNMGHDRDDEEFRFFVPELPL